MLCEPPRPNSLQQRLLAIVGSFLAGLPLGTVLRRWWGQAEPPPLPGQREEESASSSPGGWPAPAPPGAAADGCVVTATYPLHYVFTRVLLASIVAYAEDGYPPIVVAVDRDADTAGVGAICEGGHAWLCEELPLRLLSFESLLRRYANASLEALPKQAAPAAQHPEGLHYCEEAVQTELGEVACPTKEVMHHPGRLYAGVKKYLAVLHAYRELGCTGGIWLMDSESFAFQSFRFADMFAGFRRQPWLVVSNVTIWGGRASLNTVVCRACDAAWRNRQPLTSGSAALLPAWGTRPTDLWMYQGAVLEELLAVGRPLLEVFYQAGGTGEALYYFNFVLQRYLSGNPHGYRVLDLADAIYKQLGGDLFRRICLKDDRLGCSNPYALWLVKQELPADEAKAVQRAVVALLNAMPGQRVANGNPTVQCGRLAESDCVLPNLKELVVDLGWKAAWCLSNCWWPRYWEVLCGQRRMWETIEDGDIRPKVRRGQPTCRVDLSPRAFYVKKFFLSDNPRPRSRPR